MVDSDDPFNTQDATMIRPRPGAGKRGAEVPPPPVTAAVPVARSADIRLEGLAVGLNPLLQAASPVLRLAGRARGMSAVDVPDLRQLALDDIRRFEGRSRAAGIPHEIVVAARYVLCAALDEAVLSTPWGADSEWAQHPLLVELHREAWGGEKFFDMLDRTASDPRRFIDLLELQYVCLALGFTGKYQLTERGHEQLTDVRRRLYRTIRQVRGTPPAELSLRWQGLQERRNPLIRYMPWWVAAVAVAVVLIVAYTTYLSWLARAVEPVHIALGRLGFDEVPAAVQPGPTVKALLAREAAQGLVDVQEPEPGKTVITPLGGDLFASGSVDVNPSYEATLTSIARAVDAVPGRVFVVGHTDDQPLRSIRYRDNFELSRVRAERVTDVLRRTIGNHGRLTARGVGASDPRYHPPGTPENRAKNRRVEITHLAGT